MISDFLKFGGDLEVKFEEWTPLLPKDLPVEDISKLTFSHFRRVSYSHPRTTMLFILF
jgi:hypothetical protein